jgi:NADH-quinone oxidoreductase subunit L
MGGEQDIRRMGGLRKKMPVTFWTFVIACLAIAGVPPFAGFFSKDAILFHAFTSPHGSPVLWAIGVAGAALTAFYMFRLLFVTFLGETRADHHTAEHVHESPASMTVPLMVLAVLSAVAGFLGVPEALGGHEALAHWLAPVIAHPPGEHHASHALEFQLMAASVGAGLLGIFTAWLFYVRSPELPARLASSARGLHGLLLDKYRIDELYDATIVRPSLSLARGLWRFVDAFLIDGVVNGVGALFRVQSDTWRRMQTGNVQHYAYTFLVGVILLAGWLMVR